MMIKPHHGRFRIGVVTNIQHAYGRKAFRGINNFIEKVRPDVQLDLLLHKDTYPLEINNEFSGILTTIDPPNLGQIDSGIPIIQLSGLKHKKHAGCFNVDNVSIGVMAAETLYTHGVVSFNYFNGFYRKISQDQDNSRDRLNGFNDGIARLCHEPLNRRANICQSKNRIELMQWISKLPKPAGIFAFNDLRALELLESCEILRARVPEDVAIIGVDDDRNFCHLGSPYLSSIDTNITAVAYNATHQLLKLIDKSHQHDEAPLSETPIVIPRESTGGRTCTDPLVKKVLTLFERKAAVRPTLSDIASELGFSLRLLETAFQEKCGLTLKDEFLRIQLKESRRLLRTTDLSMEEIAHQLQWQSSGLQTAFKRVTGYTPGNYRKLFRSPSPLTSPKPPATLRKRKHLKRIGVIFPMTGQCFYELLQGVESYCHKYPDIKVSLCIPPPDYLLEKGFDDLADFDTVANCDGFIISGEISFPESSLKAKPMLCIDHTRNAERSWSAHVDNYCAGVLAARHFLEKGYRHFVFCNSETNRSAHRSDDLIDTRVKDRFAGFSETLRSHAIPQSHISDWSYDYVDELSPKIKKLQSKTGIFAFNDITARLLLQQCIKLKRNVPEDIAIIGCDNHEFLCQLSKPTLSSIDVNFFRAGYTCMEQLVDYLCHGRLPDSKKLTIGVRHVMERSSSASLGTSDQEIHTVINYISGNYHNDLSVADILQDSRLSRRGVEKRFRKIMGRSIMEELHYQRIHHACNLLTATNLTSKEISHRIGYINPAHFAKVFRKHKGMSPKAFRQKLFRVPSDAFTPKLNMAPESVSHISA